MKLSLLLLFTSAFGVLTLAACGDGDDEKNGASQASPSRSASASAVASATGGVNPSDFSTTIDNRFFPLKPGQKRVYEGRESSTTIRVEETVLGETDTIAGVEVRTVEAKEFEDEELSEITKDYYAQHKDGSVYYFGERVDEYSNGQVVGHGGQWLAGEGENRPGVFMPADPKVGDQFEQEQAPGIAEDTSKVVAVDQTVDVPAETVSGCIKTEDYSPIDKVTESKFYCPETGLMREEFEGGFLDLVSAELG